MGGSKGLILVVDDEESIVNLVSTALKTAGYETDSARDGREALKKVEHNPPQLIILDMNMPKMGGISFYHEIANKIDGTPRFPVMILTGRGSLETVFEGFHVDGFMAKPFRIPELLAKVEEIMKKHYGSRGGVVAMPRRKQVKRILVADSEQGMVDALTLALMNSGYEVIKEDVVNDVPLRVKIDKPDIVLMRLASANLIGPEVMIASKIAHAHDITSVPFILYIHRKMDFNEAGAASILMKAGVSSLIRYDDVKEIIRQIENLLPDS